MSNHLLPNSFICRCITTKEKAASYENQTNLMRISFILLWIFFSFNKENDDLLCAEFFSNLLLMASIISENYDFMREEEWWTWACKERLTLFNVFVWKQKIFENSFKITFAQKFWKIYNIKDIISGLCTKLKKNCLKVLMPKLIFFLKSGGLLCISIRTEGPFERLSKHDSINSFNFKMPSWHIYSIYKSVSRKIYIVRLLFYFEIRFDSNRNKILWLKLTTMLEES